MRQVVVYKINEFTRERSPVCVTKSIADAASLTRVSQSAVWKHVRCKINWMRSPLIYTFCYVEEAEKDVDLIRKRGSLRL